MAILLKKYFSSIIILSLVFSFSQSCIENKKTDTNSLSLLKNEQNKISTEKKLEIEQDKKNNQNFKKIAGAFRFSASLEREIFKTIRASLSPTMTQFEVISTILDQNSGIKKNFGLIDCKLYRLVNSEKKINIFKNCQSPETLIATIDILNTDQFSIHFYTKEWSSVVGQSVALTALDRVCELNIESEKLKRLSCEQTHLVIDQSVDIEELRLSEFVFDQKAKDQVQIKGGFYKNLIEHRKLSLNIPFDGKIKIIEKELKIQDDFAEPVVMDQTPPPKTEDSYDQSNDNKN